MRSALEWARVQTLAADGLPQREIAARWGINRRTVARMLASGEPPRYRRPPAASQLDRFEPLLRLVEEWSQIKAPRATASLASPGRVRRRLARATVHPEPVTTRTVAKTDVLAFVDGFGEAEVIVDPKTCANPIGRRRLSNAA